MRRLLGPTLLACLLAAAPAGAADRCDFRGSTTVAETGKARVFWVKGRGAEQRVYFGCLRNRRPILLASDRRGRAIDAVRTTNGLFQLAGSWVAWHHTSASAPGPARGAAAVSVRSLAGAKRRVDQDVSRFDVTSLRVASDGSVAWVMASGEFREVAGVARGAREAVPLAVERGIDSQSLRVRGGSVRFTVEGARRVVRLTAPPRAPRGRAVGEQGLDGRFGDCGTVVPAAPAPALFTGATQLARAPDGAILAAGTTTSTPGAERAEQDTFVVARLSPDGRFDRAFGTSGIVQLPVPQGDDVERAELTAAAVQPDGSVLLAGHAELEGGRASRALVLRLRPDGTLDSSFGSGGVVTDPAAAERAARVGDLALDADGGILVAGERDGRYYVARLTPRGELNRTFGSGGVLADTGKLPSGLAALAVAPDGTIFAGGGSGRPLLLRLAPDGTPLSVTSEGPPAIAALTALRATPEGGVVAVGSGENVDAPAQLLLGRYGSDGRPQRRFGAAGFVLDEQISTARDVALAADGGLLVSASFHLRPGNYAGSGLVRYTAAGARDTSFGFRGALGGTSSFGLSDHDVLVGEDGVAFVAQDNAGAFAVSRFAVAAPAIAATADRSTVCAMATGASIAPLLESRRLDVSLRLRAPGRIRIAAVVRVGDRSVKAGSVSVFRPYTEGAVAAVPLSKPALRLLRGAPSATVTLRAGAPKGARTTHTAKLSR